VNSDLLYKFQDGRDLFVMSIRNRCYLDNTRKWTCFCTANRRIDPSRIFYVD